MKTLSITLLIVLLALGGHAFFAWVAPGTGAESRIPSGLFVPEFDHGRQVLEDEERHRHLEQHEPFAQQRGFELEPTRGTRELSASPQASGTGVQQQDGHHWTLHGSVVDQAGRGLSDVSLSLAASTSATTTSDSEGAFALCVTGEGPVLVRAQREGYASTELPILAPRSGETAPLITLLTEASIGGTVLPPIGIDATSVRVWVERADSPLFGLEGPWKSADLDPTGRGFRFAGLRSGSYRVCAAAPGYALCLSEEVSVEPGTVIADLGLELVSESTLFGDVVLADGAPVCTGTVRLQRTAGLPVGANHFVQTAAALDENGRFRFHGLTPGDYELRVESPCGVHRDTTIERLGPGESRQARLVVTRGAVLQGSAIDLHGRPAVQRRILLRREGSNSEAKETVTDAEGFFRFEGIHAGSFNVQESRVVQLAEGDTRWIDLEVPTATSVKGFLRSSQGVVPNRRLRFFPTSDSLGTETATSTDGAGFYEVHGIAPGEYTVQVSPRGENGSVSSLIVPVTESHRDLLLRD